MLTGKMGEDGHKSRFHATWLRHACACDVCGNYEPGFRHRLIKDIPEDIAPGQAMAFNNQRVLHGRTEIGMTGSRRHLLHCNTDLDSFYSKLRLLYAKHNRREAGMIFPSGARL